MSQEAKTLLRDAKNLLNQEKFEEAVTVCQKILVILPTSYHGMVIHGAALFGLEKFAEACQVLEKAIALDPNTLLAWQGLGKVYEKDKMITRLKRTKICEVFRKLSGFYSTNEGDWFKLLKSKCFLAKALVFDFNENELAKENCSERLKEASENLKACWILIRKNDGCRSSDMQQVFSVFLEHLRLICSVENNNPVFDECILLLKEVYFELFYLESNRDNEENPWAPLLNEMVPQDVAKLVNECLVLTAGSGFSGEKLEKAIVALIHMSGTPRALLMYCQLLLEKNLTQPQFAKVRQLVSDEQSVLKAEYNRQMSGRAASVTKFENDTLHLVFGCLSLYEKNKSRAIEQLSAIKEPKHPLIFVYLAKAYLESGMPTEAVAIVFQGLKHCSVDVSNKKGRQKKFSLSDIGMLSSCFFSTENVIKELEALRVLALLESGTEPSYASLVQEVDDLIAQGGEVGDTLIYVASRLYSSSLTKKKYDFEVRDLLRRTELKMRLAISTGNHIEALQILEDANIQGLENDIFLLTVEALACSYFDQTETDKLSRGTTAATQALSIAAKYPLAHWTLGRCLYKLGQTKKAEEHLAEACSLQPLNSSVAYDYCKILYDSHRHEECVAIVSQLVSVSCPSQWPYIRLAIYHLEQNNANLAIHLLLAALRCPAAVSEAVDGISLEANAPKAVRLNILWRCLGSAYLQKGSMASAVRALRHCNSLSQSEKLDTSSAILLAEAYRRLGQTEAVIHCLEEECEPSVKGAVNIRKYLLLADAELQLARSLAVRCPDCTAAKCIRALVVMFERTSPQFWNVALPWKLAGDASMMLADTFEHLSSIENQVLTSKLIELLKIKQQPSSPSDWFILACRFYSTAIRITDNSPQLWSDLSIARARLAEKLDDRAKRLAISSAYLSLRLADCLPLWANLANICVLLNQNAAAQHILLSLLPKSGQSPYLLVTLSALYISTQNTEKAVECANFAREMVDAGCVETVSRPSVVPSLQIAEAFLRQNSTKMKELSDLVQLSTSLPVSASFTTRLAIYGQLLHKTIRFFAKSTTQQRLASLACKILFEQLTYVVDNCLLFCRKTTVEPKTRQNLTGLCGHVVELSPGGYLGSWKRSARLFAEASKENDDTDISSSFLWHKLRADCLDGAKDNEIDSKFIDKFGENGQALSSLLQLVPFLSDLNRQDESSSAAEILLEIFETSKNADFAIAGGIAFALSGSFAAAKRHLLQVLINLKSSGSEDSADRELRLLNTVGKIATVTKDQQLIGVVSNLAGQSLATSLFQLCSAENDDIDACCRQVASFIHSQPFRADVWPFALRHFVKFAASLDDVSSEKVKKMLEVVLSHVSPRDGLLWTAVLARYLPSAAIFSDRRPFERAILAAVHSCPFDAGVWLLLDEKKKGNVEFYYKQATAQNKSIKISFSGIDSYLR